MKERKTFLCLSATSPSQRESAGDYDLINKTFWELNDYSQIVCECEYLLPAGLIQRVVFHLWWNLRFLPKLYMTSEEEGRAKPSLSTNFTETHIIRLSPSLHGLPSTVLLADSVCLCRSRDSRPAFSMRAGGEAEGDWVRGGEWRAWTCRGNTTETPSWVVPAPSGPPPTEPADRGETFFHFSHQVLYKVHVESFYPFKNVFTRLKFETFPLILNK